MLPFVAGKTILAPMPRRIARKRYKRCSNAPCWRRMVYILIICFIVGVFSLTLNTQAQRAFGSFSNILYELLFTNQGAYMMRAYVDLWMEYVNYVSFETIFQDIPLISVAYCRFYTPPFLTIGDKNRLSFSGKCPDAKKIIKVHWVNFVSAAKTTILISAAF